MLNSKLVMMEDLFGLHKVRSNSPAPIWHGWSINILFFLIVLWINVRESEPNKARVKSRSVCVAGPIGLNVLNIRQVMLDGSSILER